MNLDELQSVRDRERQTDKLQQLRASFYADAGEFIQQLRTERERAAERADDPFDAPEVNQLTDEINTAEQTVEAIYEKRVGKIVKAASFAAADLPAEADGMTAEEQELFDTLVGDIKHNRERVLDVLAGEKSGQVSSEHTRGSDESGSASDRTREPTTEQNRSPTETSSTDVSAADAMGGTESEAPAPEPPAPDQLQDDPPIPDESPVEEADAGSGRMQGDVGTGPGTEEDPVTIGTNPQHNDSSASPLGDADSADGRTADRPVRNDGGIETADPSEDSRPTAGVGDVDRRTVRITENIDTFVGFDDREYDLGKHDVVTLPATNVGPLLDRGVAEQLE